MKKGKLLNSNINTVLSRLGHTDQFVISDAGLPIPSNVKRIDLALVKGVPSFIETLKIILNETFIEKIILAEEIKENNNKVLIEIKSLYDGEIAFVTHGDFKVLTSESKAVIRTGECTPYANVILQSGVNFEEM